MHNVRLRRDREAYETPAAAPHLSSSVDAASNRCWFAGSLAPHSLHMRNVFFEEIPCEMCGG